LYPKLIEIGDFYLPTYGVLVALGFLAGLWVTVRLARRTGLNPDTITNLAVYVALAGMLGAKILMILFDWRDYIAQPGRIFSFETLQAAGVYQGGLMLALLTAVLYARRQGLPFMLTADVFAPGVALGHGIGRLGCLAAGCCWGVQCDLPWAVTFHDPAAFALTRVPLEVPLHPSQLYESLIEFILFGLLYWRFRNAAGSGQIVGLFLALSSVARFGIEFTRFHEQGLVFGLSITQWIAIALAALGTGLLLRSRRSTTSPAESEPQEGLPAPQR
jgi:phosphatidylglycerol:prolipoprotein diacylglycerol transferase